MYKILTHPAHPIPSRAQTFINKKVSGLKKEKKINEKEEKKVLKKKVLVITSNAINHKKLKRIGQE